MPPRAISPKSWSRPARSAGSGISGEAGWTSGPGSVDRLGVAEQDAGDRADRLGQASPGLPGHRALLLRGGEASRTGRSPRRSSRASPGPAERSEVQASRSRHSGQSPSGESGGRPAPQRGQESLVRHGGYSEQDMKIEVFGSDHPIPVDGSIGYRPPAGSGRRPPRRRLANRSRQAVPEETSRMLLGSGTVSERRAEP